MNAFGGVEAWQFGEEVDPGDEHADFCVGH
jgi:hypothetical protein